MSAEQGPAAVPLRTVFAGSRGRLLGGLLAAEFGTAVQTVAEAAVLPLASRDLHGAALYGATIAGPTLTAILFIMLGPVLTARLSARGSLAASTLLYLVGVLLAALAPDMTFVFAGRLLQGAASGLLLGFGLAAIGVLYEDAVRPRVLGLFSAMWLLPSVLGPVVNSTIALAFGWRWAIAWPALVVIAARVLIGRSATLLPRPDTPPRPPIGPGLLVLAGLVLASVSPVLPGALRPAAWATGLVAALVAGVAVVRSLIARDRHRGLVLTVFAGLCIAYFGSEGLLPLGVITVAQGGVLGASIAYAAGAATWSLTGLSLLGARMKWVAPILGGVAIVTGTGTLAVITIADVKGPVALGMSIAAWAVAGLGIGLSYRVLSAATFDRSEAADAPRLGAAVAFTETMTVALAALLGTGFYSLTAGTLPTSDSIGLGYAITGAAAVAALVGAVVLRQTVRTSTSTAAPDTVTR